MPLWLASLAFYLIVWGFSALLRLASRLRFVPEDLGRLVREFAAVYQVCVPMFDVDLVWGEYGFLGVFLLILFWELVNWETLGDSEGTPLCFVQEEFLASAPPLNWLRYFLGVQLAAGALSCLPAYAFWSLGLHPSHTAAYQAPCVADLSVAPIWGGLIEGGAVFLYRWTELRTERWPNSHLASLANSALVATLTAIGLSWTGMYCNPIEAFALIFNCEGLTWIGHLGVYWAAPFLGFYAAQLNAAAPVEPSLYDLQLTHKKTL